MLITKSRRHFQTHSGVPATDQKTNNLMQITLDHLQTCPMHPTLASPPTRSKTATSPISSSPAFSPLASTTQRLGATYAPIAVIFPSILLWHNTLPTHCTSTKTAFYLIVSPSNGSVINSAFFGSVLVFTASPRSSYVNKLSNALILKKIS